MSKSIRIRTTPNGDDKYIKVKLTQDFDLLEILSLKIKQADAYQNFCSDYGVVAGRIVVNNGFGVPNVKVNLIGLSLINFFKRITFPLILYNWTFITDICIKITLFNTFFAE